MSEGSAMKSKPVRIAVEGCGHGTLNAIYSSIQQSCKVNGWDGIDLLIIGGDFQAVRNAYDLNGMSVPVKFREIGDFHEYYSGKRVAPYLTIFVGGNHEASNYLWELYYGGWVAPNIYYMGAANVLRFGPLRIAALSGIWKGYNYRKPHYERLPYNRDDVKSIYHVRELDVRKLLQVATQVDIGISHDWPKDVVWDGDSKTLFKRKGHFEPDAHSGKLGSVAARYVMDRLRPPYWFSAHLHVKFPAVVEHDKPKPKDGDAKPALNGSSGTREPGTFVENGAQAPLRNTDEIDLDMDDESEEPAAGNGQDVPPLKNTDEINLDSEDDAVEEVKKPLSEEVPEDLRSQLPASFARPAPVEPPQKREPPPGIKNKTTHFLALDKCLPHRKFLQLLEIEPITEETDSSETDSKPYKLAYDKEWLAITRVFASHLIVGDLNAVTPPDKGEAHYRPLIEQEEEWVEENIVEKGKMLVPENFEQTAPVYDPALGIRVMESPKEYSNPQTRQFCDLLQIPNPFHAEEEEREERSRLKPRPEEPRIHRGGSSRGGRGRGGYGGGRGGSRGRGRGRGRGGWGARAGG